MKNNMQITLSAKLIRKLMNNNYMRINRLMINNS